MDIRYKHNSPLKVDRGFGVYDPKAYYHTDNAMDIGYTKRRYAMNPICNNRGKRCNFTYSGTYMEGMEYFNSYFDGSATMNELLAAQMLIYLTNKSQNFQGQGDLREVSALLKTSVPDAEIYFETFKKKYARFKKREVFDKVFFARMDQLSPWIQLPYPPDMLNIQNRESFWGGGRTRNIRYRHAQWKNIADRKDGSFAKQNRLDGKNICWNVYNIMKKRYRD